MIMFTPVADWSLGCERWTDLASCRWTNDVMLRFPDVLPACCPWRMVPKILTAPYNQSLKRYSSHNRHRPSSHTTTPQDGILVPPSRVPLADTHGHDMDLMTLTCSTPKLLNVQTHTFVLWLLFCTRHSRATRQSLEFISHQKALKPHGPALCNVYVM